MAKKKRRKAHGRKRTSHRRKTHHRKHPKRSRAAKRAYKKSGLYKYNMRRKHGRKRGKKHSHKSRAKKYARAKSSMADRRQTGRVRKQIAEVFQKFKAAAVAKGYTPKEAAKIAKRGANIMKARLAKAYRGPSDQERIDAAMKAAYSRGHSYAV